MKLKTMLVSRRIGKTPRGTAAFPGQTNVQIGKMTPYVRSGEDAKGLVRAPFIDPGVPSEVNLGSMANIRSQLISLRTQQAAIGGRLPVQSLLKGRPSVGSIPCEAFLNPSDKALDHLSKNSGAFAAVAKELAQNTPGSFWVKVAEKKLYPQILDQMMGMAVNLGLDLIAPPVPPVTPDLKSAVALGFELNNAAAAYLDRVSPNSNVGLLRSVHVDPAIFRNGQLMRDTLANVRLSLEGDLDFWGIHFGVSDPGALARNPAPDLVAGAKEFAEALSSMAAEAGIWVWGSDMGPLAPVFLDQGFAFTSYTPAMTPRKVYPDGGRAVNESEYGKALNLWSWDLYDKPAVAVRKWTLDDTGYMANVVPPALRTASPADYRVNFAKPQNVAVAERFNHHYEEELDQQGHLLPGSTQVGKGMFAQWA